jgi:hypothetical protein
VTFWCSFTAQSLKNRGAGPKGHHGVGWLAPAGTTHPDLAARGRGDDHGRPR